MTSSSGGWPNPSSARTRPFGRVENSTERAEVLSDVFDVPATWIDAPKSRSRAYRDWFDTLFDTLFDTFGSVDRNTGCIFMYF